MRNYEIYLMDIIEAVEKIEKYTQDMNYNQFCLNEMVQDAVVRNLEIIGEASKRVPDEVKEKSTYVEWHKISIIRELFVHEYAKLDLKIVWDVVETKLPQLKTRILELLD